MKRAKALVVLSGGQDSTTCLAIACNEHDEVHGISFDYGQRHRRELVCARVVAEDMAECRSYKVVKIPSLKDVSDSSLLEIDKDVNEVCKYNKNLPSTFVPGRNFIFLGLAAIQAYTLGIKDIYTGVCQTDYSGYPDCRQETITRINEALNAAMEFDFKIHTPLMYLTKGQTVLKMKELGKLSWYRFTHTCYEGENPPCGKCPACKLRAKGFKEAGEVDPLVGQGTE